MMGVHPVGADIIANMKQPALAVIVRRKFHPLDIFFGPGSQFPEIARQFPLVLPTRFHGIFQRLEPGTLAGLLVPRILNRRQSLIKVPAALGALKLSGQIGEQSMTLWRNVIQRQPGSKGCDVVRHGLHLMPEAIEPVVQFAQIGG